tara:strand:+ start:257 stop:943 length:687 start_codon:yes stop_codon:yes gene_type:complete
MKTLRLDKTQYPFLIEDWGHTEYGEAFERQKAYLRDRIDGERRDTLVFTEHLPVFTTGARIAADSHLIWDEEQLAKKGIAVYKSNRGGDITYHGPNQLTAYLIFSLDKIRDLRVYLKLIEDMLIQITSEFGLKARRREGKTGIWIEKRKIAAIGIAVKSWVSYHGVALNVNNDLTAFQGIVPCGIVDGSVTSLQKELGFPVEMEKVKSIVSAAFNNTFRDYFTELDER